MAKKFYLSPMIMAADVGEGGSGTVVGGGSGQGTITVAMSYDEWWEEIAGEGENPDADYNHDGVVNQTDYDYYIAHELWKG